MEAGWKVLEAQSTDSCQTSTGKESQKRATTSPNRPSHPTVMPRCVQSAPAAPLTPAPHILQRRFDQRRESECAPCYLAGSRPWTRHMIAECRAFGGGVVAPRAGRSDYYWLPEESQLWWRGQVFTSSPPQGSLSDPAPTPSTCAPPANAQFSTLRLPTLLALDCCL